MSVGAESPPPVAVAQSVRRCREGAAPILLGVVQGVDLDQEARDGITACRKMLGPPAHTTMAGSQIKDTVTSGFLAIGLLCLTGRR